MRGLLVAGTSSDAGKSLVVTGLCRAWRRQGIDVVPFKAQNMSNNSMVTCDNGEIGRAQYLQAQAARVEPSTLMNPVLLKPGSDKTSFVVVRGRPAGELRAGQYAHERQHLAQAAHAAYEELAAGHELVVAEGAGSPAEINLRRGDYTNMGLARRFSLPVVLVGDIDRGGVLASLFGTWALLEAADRALLAGFIINKFRGDLGILEPGLAEISQRTGLTSFGVVPWLADVWLDGEDTLEVGRWRSQSRDDDPDGLRVAVVRLPRISNATDVDALAHEPGVDVVVTTDPAICRDADLVVLPGSRSTVHDLRWLHQRGLAEAIAHRHRAGLATLGICGGYQMLGGTIRDGIEGEAGEAEGLGLLPHDVEFLPAKTLARPTGTWRGHVVDGYEIHHGHCVTTGEAEPFLDGARVGPTWGTMWHGALENDAFRRAWLAEVAASTGSGWRPLDDAPGFRDRRESMIEALADAMEEHLDLDEILALTSRR